MVYNVSPSLHIALEESSNKDSATSGTGGSLAAPSLRGCNMVSSTDCAITTPVLENTPALQTIPTVTVRTAMP
jgi:hypothetical protein